MQVKREQLSPTNVKLIVTADVALMQEVKLRVLQHLSQRMKLAGFRPGKAPLAIVERQADPSVLQSEFLDEALNQLYDAAVKEERLRAVGQPKVSLQKFVPFTDLEVTIETEAIGDVNLPDYKKLKLVKETVVVTAKDVDTVIEDLRVRTAEKKEVDRAAANGDEVTIDFTGSDAKTKEPVKGADGKGYALVLGSDMFIPGFEANLVGLKAGESKEFVLAFPKDYVVKALQNRKVNFAVTVVKVQEVVKPKVDDAFAVKAGPFQTLTDLKSDIRKQLESEKQREADRSFQNRLLELLANKTTVAVPNSLIDSEVEHTIEQIRQNLIYRGQTWEEYLDGLGQTDTEYRKSLRQPAEQRVKAGLALSEVADKENITVTPEEFQLRMQLLKGQYTDKLMQTELEKPENARQILSSMLTDKTVTKLSEYATVQ